MKLHRDRDGFGPDYTRCTTIIDPLNLTHKPCAMATLGRSRLCCSTEHITARHEITTASRFFFNVIGSIFEGCAGWDRATWLLQVNGTGRAGLVA